MGRSKLPPDSPKKCYICGTVKPRCEFYSKKSVCSRECNAIQFARWYKKNRAYFNEYSRIWRDNNPEKVKDIVARCRAKKGKAQGESNAAH